MILDLQHEHTDYIKHILPFVKSGIFIDTSVMKIFFDGYIETVFSHRTNEEYENLLALLQRLKTYNKWEKLYITPQILSEIIHHLQIGYDKYKNYCDIIEAVFPVLKELREDNCICKEDILSHIDINNPILEMGDISIFVTIAKRIDNLGKIAILAKDKGIRRRYENDPQVLMIDFTKAILDLQILSG
jgi:hypothetical protein